MPALLNKTTIRKLSSGDEKAFRQVYDAYKGKLYFYALKFTKNKPDAEEIVQQAFIKLWDVKHDINLNFSFDAYLFKITKNLSLNYLKKRASETLRNQDIALNVTHEDHLTEDTVTYREFEEVALQAIEALPEKRQIIFKMRNEEGRSAEEIAEMLGISVNTVKSQLVKASKTIKECLSLHTNSLLLWFLMMVFK